jgi:two-component system KDP operon response regulator KdpE
MSAAGLTVVVVEDERQIRRFLRTALESEGWEVFEAESVKTALIEATVRKPDLLFLDLGLPDGDGVDVIRDVRTWSKMPIIVLSARSDEKDKIEALDAGADDYLTKPFSVGELLARVRANVRRRQDASPAPDTVFIFGDVKIDLSARVVTRAGEEVHLTPIEYRLLTTFAANAGRVLTHRHLLKEVWGPVHTQSAHYLRVHMGHLRRKLEEDPAQPRHFITETGIGYRLRTGV